MENKDTRCNVPEGFVMVPIDEYNHLVYESARNDIVKHLIMAEESTYINPNAIKIALGIYCTSPAHGTLKGESDE